MSGTKPEKLFSPVQLGPYALKHRIVMPPMSRLRANWPTGIPSDMMRDYYTQRASEGGLIFTEANAVLPTGRAYHTGPGIYSDEQVEGWQEIVRNVHAKKGIFFAQLTHSGRATSAKIIETEPVAASIDPAFWVNKNIVVSAPGGFTLPSPHRALEIDEIPKIIEAYRLAAENVKRAGFDGVDILAGNGHLVEQFLHDGTNKRADRYGGSTENRTRLLLEILEAVVGVWGGERVGVRISPSSVFAAMGDSNPRALYGALAERLNDFNLAYLHVIEPRISGADTIDAGQEPVAAMHLRQIFKGKMIAAGGFQPETAEEAVANGVADLISFGRPFTSNPDLPARIQRGQPLTPYDRNTFYAFDEKGYTDFTSFGETKAEPA